MKSISSKDYALLDKQREIRVYIKNSPYNFRKGGASRTNVDGTLKIGAIKPISRYFPGELLRKIGKVRSKRKKKKNVDIFEDNVDLEKLAKGGDSAIFNQEEKEGEDEEAKNEDNEEVEYEEDTELQLDEEDDYHKREYDVDDDVDRDDDRGEGMLLCLLRSNDFRCNEFLMVVLW
jgi:hypothetical protein